MKAVLPFALAGAALTLPLLVGPRADGATALAEAQSYSVDAGHSSVVFKVQHMGVANFYGTFDEVAGAIVYDAGDPSACSVEITIQADSVDSRAEGRDEHIKNADFLSAAEFPELTFVSSGVEKGRDDVLQVTGELTMRGVSKEITVPVEVTGQGDTRFGPRAGFETTFSVSMEDFEMPAMQKMGPDALGRDIELTIALECTLDD